MSNHLLIAVGALLASLICSAVSAPTNDGGGREAQLMDKQRIIADLRHQSHKISGFAFEVKAILMWIVMISFVAVLIIGLSTCIHMGWSSWRLEKVTKHTRDIPEPTIIHKNNSACALGNENSIQSINCPTTVLGAASNRMMFDKSEADKAKQNTKKNNACAQCKTKPTQSADSQTLDLGSDVNRKICDKPEVNEGVQSVKDSPSTADSPSTKSPNVSPETEATQELSSLGTGVITEDRQSMETAVPVQGGPPQANIVIYECDWRPNETRKIRLWDADKDGGR